jgi:ribonuclease Z
MPMTLTILGTSSALPTSERFPSAHVLIAHERFFLIDCGEGTQMQLRKNKIRFSRINHIFISHLHGDHVFGLYGLISTFSLMGRKVTLNIYAPAGYNQMLMSHLADFDIHLNYNIDFHPLEGKDPFMILDDRYLTVEAFPLEHRVPAFGFLFREKPGERKIIKEAISRYGIPVPRLAAIKKGADFVDENGRLVRNEELTKEGAQPISYAYCSDTRYFKRLASFVKNVDLLYHEATFGAENAELAKITGHSTTLEAARVALDANAGTLLIGHFSSRYRKVEPLVSEARQIFRETYAAVDGSTYDIGKFSTQ